MVISYWLMVIGCQLMVTGYNLKTPKLVTLNQ